MKRCAWEPLLNGRIVQQYTRLCSSVMLFIDFANVLLPLIKALFILIVACSFDVSPPYAFEIIKGVAK